MGRFIIKPKKDEDFYVEWSTIVDNWITAGTRQEMIDEAGIDEKRLVRADEYGSSLLIGKPTFDEDFMIHNLPDEVYEAYDYEDGYYEIHRGNIKEYVHLTEDNSVMGLDPHKIRGLLVFHSHE